MSSAAEALLLSGELDKLEIAPTLPQVKLLDNHLPLSLNPFYDAEHQLQLDNVGGGSTSSALQLSGGGGGVLGMPQDACHMRPLPTHCRKCRQRRRSESVLDDYKVASAAAAAAATSTVSSEQTCVAGTPRTTPGVQRRVLKKTAALSTGARGKQLIRPPVLRALQTCFLHQPPNGVRRRLLRESTETDENVAAAEALPASSGISDFRDLISECQTLLASEVGFKKKNFMTLRERQIGAGVKDGCGGVASSSSSQQLPSHNNSSSNSSSSITLPSLNADIVRSVSPTSSSLEQPGAGGGGGGGAASRTSPNTSCSQQAGATPAAAAADDVTIDELACYFDTLVHIPKKMSSMAEMMYI